MRPAPNPRLEKLRRVDLEIEYAGDSVAGTNYGIFQAKPFGSKLHIMSSAGDDSGWEHISVSAIGRCPYWLEMCWVKDLFWEPEECVVQYHPPRSDYRNHHPYTLHLWKPIGIEIPRPPGDLVGPKEEETVS